MKHVKVFTLVMILLIISFSFLACGSKSDKTAKELVQVLSRPELPFNISAKEQTAVKEATGHLVTLTDAHIQINPEFIRAVNPQAEKNMSLESFKDLHMTAKNIVFYYEKEKVLEIRKISGFNVNVNEALMTKLVKKDPKGTFNLTVSVEEMDAEGYNLTAFLSKELKSTKELFAAMMQNSQKQSFNTKGFIVDFNGSKTGDEGDERFSGKATIAGIQILQNMNGQIMHKMYGNSEDIGPELFEKALKENQTLVDVLFDINGLKVEGVTQDKDGENKFDFATNKLNIVYKIVPNEEKSAFVLTTSSNLEGLHINVPKKPEIGKIASVEKLATEFSFSPISPNLAVTYMQIMQGAMNADQSNEEGQKKFQEEMGQKGMAAMGELMQAKPMVHFKVSPLVHAWTTIEGQADMSMEGMTPVGKVLLSVTNAASLVETVARELAPDKKTLDELAEFISKYLILAQDGTGKMTLEMNAQQPGKPIINGK